jgi:two-component system response regulator AtoC
VKILRVLEEKTVRRVGEKNERVINFRVIAATNKDLALAVSENKFRRDLYFRLEEYPIYLPPLRERKEDIPLLAQHFLIEFCESNDMPTLKFSKQAIQALMNYDWFGNIRELKNVVRRSAVRTAGEIVDNISFSSIENSFNSTQPASILSPDLTKNSTDGNFTPLDKIEKDAIEKAYFFSDKNASEAAKLLGISRATMYRKLKKLGYES